MNARAWLTRTLATAFAAAMTTFGAGASAAYLSEDLYGTARLPAAAQQSDEAVPQGLAGLKTDEGVPQKLH